MLISLFLNICSVQDELQVPTCSTRSFPTKESKKFVCDRIPVTPQMIIQDCFVYMSSPGSYRRFIGPTVIVPRSLARKFGVMCSLTPDESVVPW